MPTKCVQTRGSFHKVFIVLIKFDFLLAHKIWAVSYDVETPHELSPFDEKKTSDQRQVCPRCQGERLKCKISMGRFRSGQFVRDFFISTFRSFSRLGVYYPYVLKLISQRFEWCRKFNLLDFIKQLWNVYVWLNLTALDSTPNYLSTSKKNKQSRFISQFYTLRPHAKDRSKSLI